MSKKPTQSARAIVSIVRKKFFGLCLKYSASYADAQDNFQEGFLIIFRKINQYSGKGSFEGWAKKILINYALQKYKGVRFMEVLNDNIPDVDVAIDEEEITLDYLLQIIQELPDQYRIVFSLYVLDDYSHQEISEMLSISTGTTKSNLHRARLILKEKIEKRRFPNLKISAK